jgi:hypothetical protein
MGGAYTGALCADEFGGNAPKRDNFFKNEPKPPYLRRTHQNVTVQASQGISDLKEVVSMEPRCSQCESPKYLRHPEEWKTCEKPVLAGLVCVWCGHVERGVYAIRGSTQEDHEE